MPDYFTYLTDDDDLLQGADTITPSSENSLFPASNLRDKDVSLITKTAAGVVSANWLIDLGASADWDLISILAHNFQSTSTLTLQAGPTNAVSSFSESITWREFDAFKRRSATVNHRFIKLTVADSGNPDNHLSMGAIRIGLSTMLTNNYSYGWRRRHRTENRVLETDLRVKNVDRLVQQKLLVFDFTSMLKSESDTLAGFLNSLEREAIPVFVIPQPSVYEGYWMNLVSDPEEVIGRRQEIRSVMFEEVSRGVKLDA